MPAREPATELGTYAVGCLALAELHPDRILFRILRVLRGTDQRCTAGEYAFPSSRRGGVTPSTDKTQSPVPSDAES